jgi:hypothetical protein
VRLSILDPVRLMYLRPESRAKFDICTYLAGFWISNVLSFPTDDTMISPFGVAIPFVFPLPAMASDSPSFHTCRSGTCKIDNVCVSIITHGPERDL